LRRLWILLSAGLFLASAAQGLQTYYQSFAHAPALTPWPSDVLFILWVTPTVMMFLPQSREESGGLDWQQVLDYAQVGVVALTAYLYFFYIPSRWAAEGPQMVMKVLRVQLARDVVLAAGFLVQSVATKTSSIRSFFARMSGVFILAAASSSVYLLQSQGWGTRASWQDLTWCAPFLFVTLFAAAWRYEQVMPVQEPRSSLQFTGFSQALPILIPVLVLFMGRSIAAEQITISWIAIATSFGLSAASLLLTTEKQRGIANDLRQTQKALGRSERMFSTAFRSSPDAVGITSLPAGVFLEVNEGFTRLTGYAHAETLGRTPVEMNLWVDPSHRSRVMSRLQDEGEIRDEEFQCRTKNGEVRNCQFSGMLIQLDEGPCALVIVRDITARKNAEEALRASEERFRTLVKEMDVGVVLHGPDGEILYANQAAQDIFEIPLEAAKGKTSGELNLIAFDEDGTEIPYELRPAPRVVRSGQIIKNEVIGWRRPGLNKVIWTLSNVVPIRSPEGAIAGVISTFTDVTERLRIEEALRQLSTRLLEIQDEERRRLGRELHDSLAQTVLAVNLNLAQAAQFSNSLSERSKQALEEARHLLQEMSQEIRTLSYLLHPPLLDELGLVSAIKEYAEGFSERSGIRLELDLPAGFGRLPQETETALFRIVQESLSNIQRHSGSEAAKISLSTGTAWARLEIRDQGKGMEQRPVQLQGTGRARLGVGILGMRERMTQLGGKLEIESGPSGTTVRARIPLRGQVPDAGSHSHRG
jgi:PAS domain S-box-containing protein